MHLCLYLIFNLMLYYAQWNYEIEPSKQSRHIFLQLAFTHLGKYLSMFFISL